MLTLTNLSNADCDEEKLLQNSSGTLAEILHTHLPDGIEFMLCAPWDRTLFPPTYIKGVHLLFWPTWVDFWRGNDNPRNPQLSLAYMDGYGTINLSLRTAFWRECNG